MTPSAFSLTTPPVVYCFYQATPWQRDITMEFYFSTVLRAEGESTVRDNDLPGIDELVHCHPIPMPSYPLLNFHIFSSTCPLSATPSAHATAVSY